MANIASIFNVLDLLISSSFRRFSLGIAELVRVIPQAGLILFLLATLKHLQQ
jgi:hypothetical protein